ncbi:MAG TPA: ROK family protein [Acidobacteriaceae bacterium]|nr:ROK family protein [Acidobacteriaceae bacterium]
MAKSVGVFLTGRIATGVIEGQSSCSSISHFPENPDENDSLLDTPLDGLMDLVCAQIQRAGRECGPIDAVGLALPGIVREGVVEDSPNLIQLKGARIAERLRHQLQTSGIAARVAILNDADAVAAGIAAKVGRLDKFIRVWTLGYGIGFGRYPFKEGIWEGGHCTITLDAGEMYCGCGGRGHLEGVMGHRAMRLRFLDMEPEEVFEASKAGDQRCASFVRIWHRSLAAATANSIHMEGAGRFYYTGFNVKFLDLKLLQHYLQQMVKMSPLQNYTVEAMPMTDDLAVTGAAIAAAQTGE